MIHFNDKTAYKLLHTKPCTGLALCKSSARPVWDFVLLIKRTLTMKKTLSFLVLGLLVLPCLSFASFDTSLKYGNKGQAVTELQDFLVDQGYLTGSPTGNFYSLTLKAVKAFQVANKLPGTGFFGPQSRAKASELLDLADSDTAEQAETGTVAAPVVQPKPTQSVTDTATQAKLDDLTKQLQAQNDYLNTIAQNTAPVVQSSVMETPEMTCSMTSDTPDEDGNVNLTWTSENIPDGVTGDLYASGGGHNGSQVVYGRVAQGLAQSGTMKAPQGTRGYIYRLTFAYRPNVRADLLKSHCYAVFGGNGESPATPTVPEGINLVL